MTLQGPDNSPIYDVANPGVIRFFASGGGELFGLHLRAAMDATVNLSLKDFDPDRTVDLRIPGFLTQQVILWKDKWVSRGAVIKYVANIASGVHSGSAQTDDERLLSDARHHVVMGLRGDKGIGLAFRPPDQEYDDTKLDFSAAAIDVLLIEMFAAARYMANSPSITKLEAIIKAELSGASTA